MFLFRKTSAFPIEFIIQLSIAKLIDKLVCYESVTHACGILETILRRWRARYVLPDNVAW